MGTLLGGRRLFPKEKETWIGRCGKVVAEEEEEEEEEEKEKMTLYPFFFGGGKVNGSPGNMTEKEGEAWLPYTVFPVGMLLGVRKRVVKKTSSKGIVYNTMPHFKLTSSTCWVVGRGESGEKEERNQTAFEMGVRPTRWGRKMGPSLHPRVPRVCTKWTDKSRWTRKGCAQEMGYCGRNSSLFCVCEGGGRRWDFLNLY